MVLDTWEPIVGNMQVAWAPEIGIYWHRTVTTHQTSG